MLDGFIGGPAIVSISQSEKTKGNFVPKKILCWEEDKKIKLVLHLRESAKEKRNSKQVFFILIYNTSVMLYCIDH